MCKPNSQSPRARCYLCGKKEASQCHQDYQGEPRNVCTNCIDSPRYLFFIDGMAECPVCNHWFDEPGLLQHRQQAHQEYAVCASN